MKKEVKILFVSFVLLISFFVGVKESSAQVQNFYIMEDDGTLIIGDQNGFKSLNLPAVTQKFYQNYPDEYDFSAVFTDFPLVLPGSYIVFNDAKGGVGQAEIDLRSNYGSNSKLRTVSLLDLSVLDTRPGGPLDKISDLGLLLHEIGHHWAVYINDILGITTKVAFGHYYRSGHVSAIGELADRTLDTGGDIFGGDDLIDNGDGTFLSVTPLASTAVGIHRKFSPLTLYLMGLIPKEEVPDMIFVTFDLSKTGSVFFGTKRVISINDVINLHGERIPSYANSQKDFSTALILLVEKGKQPTQKAIDRMNNLIDNFSWHWTKSTRCRSTITTTLSRDNAIKCKPISTNLSTVASSPISVSADGSSTATITVTLKDDNGNPLPNRDVRIIPDNADKSLLAWHYSQEIRPFPEAGVLNTDSAGKATFTVKSKVVTNFTYFAIADGIYLDSKPEVSFVVPDTAPSTCQITSPAPGEVIASTTASVSGSATDNTEPTSVMCSGVAATLTGTGTTKSFSASVGLSEGSNTITCTAKDAANLQGTCSVTVTRDTTPPDTTITANPLAITNSTSATFSFTSTESGSTFQCKLDTEASFSSCSSPKSYTVTAGSRTFQVKATDPAGNPDPTPASYSWTIDTTPPQTPAQVQNFYLLEDDGTFISRDPTGKIQGINNANIHQEYYKRNADDVDFIHVYTNFPNFCPCTAYASPVKFEESGIRNTLEDRQTYNFSASQGSNNKLKGFSYMNDVKHWNEVDLSEHDRVLLHETEHFWASYVGGAFDISYDGAHWRWLFNAELDPHGGGQTWTDLGDGTFKKGAHNPRLRFFSLALYLLGFVLPEEVTETFLVNLPDTFNLTRLSDGSLLYYPVSKDKPITKTIVSVKDITDFHGIRKPSSLTSQKSFKSAFILLTEKGNVPTQAEKDTLNNLAGRFPQVWDNATGARSRMEIATFPQLVDKSNFDFALSAGYPVSLVAAGLETGPGDIASFYMSLSLIGGNPQTISFSASSSLPLRIEKRECLPAAPDFTCWFDVFVPSPVPPIGNYPITITATGGGITKQQSVTLKVLPAEPKIRLSPADLSLTAQEGGLNPASRLVGIANLEGGNLNWTASVSSAPSGWLKINKTSGGPLGIYNPLDALVVSADISGLAAGTYNGAVTVSGVGASNTPQTVSVTLTIIAPALNVSKTGTGIGTVTSVPAGISCGATCSASFTNGTSITLTAAASAESTFTGWSGAGCSGTGTCTFTITADTTVTANFDPFTLNAAPAPTISLSPTSFSSTAVQGSSPASQTLNVTNSGPSGSTLSWSATDDATWLSLSLSPISGSGSLGSGASASVTITYSTSALATGSYSATIAVSDPGASNTPQTVSVTLTIIAPALNVSKTGTGIGTVTSVPAGISCGATCSASFTNGTSITLTAAASVGSTFTGWSGAGCSGTRTCTFTITADTTVTANFDPSAPAPTISLSLTSFSVSAVQGGPSPADQTLTITNSGPAGSTLSWEASKTDTWFSFSQASGSLGAGASASVNISYNILGLTEGIYTAKINVFDLAATNSPQSVSVSLTIIAPALNVSKTGTGIGTVTSVPAGISCGATCSASFTNGTSITLTAAASVGSTFTGWSGAGCSGTRTCTFTITADTTVTANFDPSAPAPTISLSQISFSVSAVQGGLSPADQTLTITNSGPAGSTLNWEASKTVTWISFSQASGSLGAGASASVKISYNILGLTEGIYTAKINVFDLAATNSPQSVSVSLTISAPPSPPVVDVNQAPSSPSQVSLEQYEDEARTKKLMPGGIIYKKEVFLTGIPIDPDGGLVRLQVEVVRFGTSFVCKDTSLPTDPCVTASSLLVASGTPVAAEVSNLSPGEYIWRMRSVDEAGFVSPWIRPR